MRDIEVLHFSEDKTSSEFTIQNPLSYVTGKDLLAGRITKLMFTQIGSDSYNLEMGTTFYDIMKVYREDELDNVRASLPVIIKTLEEQVKRDQIEELINGKILKDDEILNSLVLKNYVFDDTFGGWIITIEVNTKSGETAFVQIP